ncbi:MAG: hypothetical protein IPM96_18945 [Ignavibacteria bacterium]|nr:hypothetical protein [Ignavibacteria bacterium]
MFPRESTINKLVVLYAAGCAKAGYLVEAKIIFPSGRYTGSISSYVLNLCPAGPNCERSIFLFVNVIFLNLDPSLNIS